MSQLSLHSPIGDLTIFEHENIIVALEWGWGANQISTPFLENAKTELHEYFSGTRKEFSMKTTSADNDLIDKIYEIMKKIPYGETMTYGEIAKKVKTGPRIVGSICGKNPIPIIVPCHRVMGANGKLTGYSGDGGLDTKIALLTLEGSLDPVFNF